MVKLTAPTTATTNTAAPASPALLTPAAALLSFIDIANSDNRPFTAAERMQVFLEPSAFSLFLHDHSWSSALVNDLGGAIAAKHADEGADAALNATAGFLADLAAKYSDEMAEACATILRWERERPADKIISPRASAHLNAAHSDLWDWLMDNVPEFAKAMAEVERRGIVLDSPNPDELEARVDAHLAKIEEAREAEEAAAKALKEARKRGASRAELKALNAAYRKAEAEFNDSLLKEVGEE
jgi:hypothetical protein